MSILINLEQMKEYLVIPLGDHSQDAQLQQSIQKASGEIEAWTKRRLGLRRYHDRIDFSGARVKYETPFEVIGWGCLEMLKFFFGPGDPAGLQEWIEEAGTVLQENPADCVGWSRHGPTATCSRFSCTPHVYTSLSCDGPGYPILQIQSVEAYFRREHSLVFVAPNKRMDVFIGQEGERERFQAGRKDKDFLRPYTSKRIYFFPRATSAKRDLQLWLKDTMALFCVYLVQEKFVDIDEDRPIREFLLDYLKGFKEVKELGAHEVLAEILRNYRIPEDFRAFRSYVRKTADGLIKNQRKQENPRIVPLDPTSPGYNMIPAVAERLDIPRGTLYDLVNKGKVQAEEILIEGKQYKVIPQAEVERLSLLLEQDRKKAELVKDYADIRGIDKKSAQRWVQRQEEKGLGIEEILQKLDQEILAKLLSNNRVMGKKAAKKHIQQRISRGETFRDIAESLGLRGESLR